MGLSVYTNYDIPEIMTEIRMIDMPEIRVIRNLQSALINSAVMA
jgi:hypothetical protein